MLFIWHGLIKRREETPSMPVISKNINKETSVVIDLENANAAAERIESSSKVIHKEMQHHETQQNLADGTILNDSISVIETDSITHDTIKIFPNIINQEELIAQDDFPSTRHDETQDWSLSLAYTGNIGHNDFNRYRMLDPDIEGPADEIEVTERTRHYMPLVIGLSVNKSLTSRWGMETGLRYTFLRSDFISESALMNKETIQRIHYTGVLLKLNYRIFTYNGFSLYGQGGGALDIPVYGTQSIWEYSPKPGTMNKDVLHVHAPVQWSVEGGLGIQYHFTLSFSIYAEPSFRYYFNTGSDLKTIWQEKPFEFAIPIGLRITW